MYTCIINSRKTMTTIQSSIKLQMHHMRNLKAFTLLDVVDEEFIQIDPEEGYGLPVLDDTNQKGEITFGGTIGKLFKADDAYFIRLNDNRVFKFTPDEY